VKPAYRVQRLPARSAMEGLLRFDILVCLDVTVGSDRPGGITI
jgi:hypothetical protein